MAFGRFAQRIFVCSSLCVVGCAGTGIAGANAVPEEGDSETRTRVSSGFFSVVRTVGVAAAPHGIAFSDDGGRAFVACSGADVIAVVDLDTGLVIEERNGGSTPLDVFIDGSGALVATQFRGNRLVRVPDEPGLPALGAQTVGRGPSLFSPAARGERFVSCEQSNEVCLIDAKGISERRWETPAAPYPPSVTRDGILLFVPCRDAGEVLVIDTLNNKVVETVKVGKAPEGGALTNDDVSYIVACGGDNELRYINTASFEIVRTVSEGVGPRPFAVTLTTDGRFGLVNNAGGDTVSILDVAQGRIVGDLRVGEQPIVVRAHPDGRRLYVSCEASNTLVEIAYSPTTGDVSRDAERKTEVIVLGMIHSGHLTSDSYSVGVVGDLLRAIGPDEVFTEIPPNRLDKALRQLIDVGIVTEPRVSRFPEYVDALFPLLEELGCRVVPCAGWTAEMSDYRSAALKNIKNDSSRADDWRAYSSAAARMDEQLGALGDDNPRVIHSRVYDEVTREGLGPYNRLFNDELHDGGWDNINAKHYALIERRLDEISGLGKRVAITFGAGHKYWFLDRLRERDDVSLMEVSGFLDQIEASE